MFLSALFSLSLFLIIVSHPVTFRYLVQFGDHWRNRKLFRKFVVYGILDHRATHSIFSVKVLIIVISSSVVWFQKYSLVICLWLCVFISFEPCFNPPVYPIKVSYHHTFLFCIIIFFPSLSETKAQLSLCLYTLQMNAYPCKFLKKKGWEFEYFA